MWSASRRARPHQLLSGNTRVYRRVAIGALQHRGKEHDGARAETCRQQHQKEFGPEHEVWDHREKNGGRRVGRGAESRASSATDTSDNQPQRSIADDGELLAGVKLIGHPVHGCAVSCPGGRAVTRESDSSPPMRAQDPEGRPPGSLGLGIRGGCVHTGCVRPENRSSGPPQPLDRRDRASFTPGRNGQDAGSRTPDESFGATTSHAVSGCKRGNVQESCTNLVATGRRSGSARRKEPGAEQKLRLPGAVRSHSGRARRWGWNHGRPCEGPWTEAVIPWLD